MQSAKPVSRGVFPRRRRRALAGCCSPQRAVRWGGTFLPSSGSLAGLGQVDRDTDAEAQVLVFVQEPHKDTGPRASPAGEASVPS